MARPALTFACLSDLLVSPNFSPKSQQRRFEISALSETLPPGHSPLFISAVTSFRVSARSEIGV